MAEDNLFKRLALIKKELAEAELTKSGKNSFQNYSYYELDDFLPTVTKLNNKHGVVSLFNMEKYIANLTLINVDDSNDRCTLNIPVEELTLKGGQPIQNLGGQITYLRRYLYMAVYDISERSIVEDPKVEKELTLSKVEKEKISNADNLEDLNTVCNEIVKKKGIKYKTVVTEAYGDRKKELLNENISDSELEEINANI